MTFYIIGSGNMAWFLTGRLLGAGHTCKGIYGRNNHTVAELAIKHDIPVCNSIDDIKDDADWCILTVSDNAIKSIADQLSLKNTLLVHTAGATNIDILANAAMAYGVLWPIYSITKDNLPMHREIPVVYEGATDEIAEKIKSIAADITNIYHEANEQERNRLHLCAVLSNNFTNHLMTIAASLCSEKEIPFSLLQPIIQQTAERIQYKEPYDLQTGPARRHDTRTQQKHIEMLRQYPDWQRIYESMNASIKAMYEQDKQRKG